MLKNYFKTAWRSIWKNTTLSIINIVGLSIGMAAAVLIFLWVNNEIIFDNYHKVSGNIYRLINSWLQNFAYKINLGWWMLALSGLIALCIAPLTVSFQAIKAAIANPVKSLRTE